MDSFILDDVNELLQSKKGDSTRLLRIKEACESNELISLSDRKYVERLSSQYLRKPEPKKQDRPKLRSLENEVLDSTEEGVEINQSPPLEKTISSKEVFLSEKSQEQSSKIKKFPINKRIILPLASIVLAIVLIAIVASNNDGILIQNNSEPINNDVMADFSLETDRTSYETSDIISISGKMDSSSTGTVRLFIENEKMELIWAENLALRNNGEFSTLVIAGGQGWEGDGKYYLNVEYNEFSNSISFDFDAR